MVIMSSLSGLCAVHVYLSCSWLPLSPSYFMAIHVYCYVCGCDSVGESIHTCTSRMWSVMS